MRKPAPQRMAEVVPLPAKPSIPEPLPLYKIVKASQGPGAQPYSGRSCERAGVEPGRIYGDYDEALVDARKLHAVNAVGFDVVFHREDAQ